ncbi:5'-3' exonuclease family protein [Carex rostrata]
MGVGGRFWELLKPYSKYEDIDFLRGKRVAIDLPFWIVQHDAAIRARLPHARNPHLRTTFFRTVALFSKMGVFPIFVIDGNPSPLKHQARIERFFRGSGLDSSELVKALVPTDGKQKESPVKRNPVYTQYIKECTELLELLGMHVLRADGEAEALCAQLNREGCVDACITADSDAFLFGAKCVIKSLRSNSKEPFECYKISDIESGLGLKRNQMIAIALLVGNDHDLHGVLGVGVDTALRLVRLFSEDEIFDRLRQISKGSFSDLEKANEDMDTIAASTSMKSPHCSNCGHPGSKRAHSKIACEYCFPDGSEFSCVEKSTGFICICPSCDQERKIKEKKRHENWLTKVCEKIASEKNFPNDEIIQLYLRENHGGYGGTDSLVHRWDNYKLEELIDFLVYHQHWDPSYIRKSILPMQSTIYLRKIADSPSIEQPLLSKQYEFDSIQRVKIQRGHRYYLVKWRRAVGCNNFGERSSEESTIEEQTDPIDPDVDLLDEPVLPEIVRNDKGCYLLTDENMELVQAAFPKAVERFHEEQRMKELKSMEKKSKSTGIQKSITEFYRSTKGHGEGSKMGEVQKSRGKEKASADLDENLPKSIRRRLLFG